MPTMGFNPSSSTNMSTSASTERRRATRACDQCRRTKSRCDNPGLSSQPCRNCLASAIHCTYLQPCHKRGPPKGYLSALEHRLHCAEGLLGIIISSNDSRAMTLVSDLSKDSLAKSIIRTVSDGEFGPIGRYNAKNAEVKCSLRQNPSYHCEPMDGKDAPYVDHNGHLVFHTPTNTWQDYVKFRIFREITSRCQVPMKTLSRVAVSRPSLPTSPSGPSFTSQAFVVPPGPLRPSDAEPVLRNVESYTSSGGATLRKNGSNSDHSKLSSPTMQRSPSTPEMDLIDTGSYREGEYLSLQTSYTPLAQSLGLDDSLHIPGQSFSVHFSISSPPGSSGFEPREEGIPPSSAQKIGSEIPD